MAFQYQERIRDLQQLKNQTSRWVNELDRLQGDERSKKIREIEENLSNLNQLIQSIKDEFPIKEETERSKIATILQDYQVDTQTLEDRFRVSKNRGEFMGSFKIDLEDESNSEKQQLLNQREGIKEGETKLQSFNEFADEIMNIGKETLDNLENQKEKILENEDKIMNLGPDDVTMFEIGRNTDRKLCCQKRRTAILYMVIVIVIIIFLAVFFYIIFR